MQQAYLKSALQVCNDYFMRSIPRNVGCGDATAVCRKTCEGIAEALSPKRAYFFRSLKLLMSVDEYSYCGRHGVDGGCCECSLRMQTLTCLVVIISLIALHSFRGLSPRQTSQHDALDVW